MGFFRREYWSGLPHALLQGNFLTQGSNPGLMSPALADGFFTTSNTQEAPPPHTHTIWTTRGPSLGAQMVKNLLVMQETRVQSLGWNNALEKGMAIHSSTLAWRIPWTEETGRLQSMGFQRLRHDWVTLSYDMVIMSPFIGSRVCISNDSELGHFTYVDQWAEVGMGLSHNLKMHCKIPLTLLRFSPFPKEEHTPDRH